MTQDVRRFSTPSHPRHTSDQQPAFSRGGQVMWSPITLLHAPGQFPGTTGPRPSRSDRHKGQSVRVTCIGRQADECLATVCPNPRLSYPAVRPPLGAWLLVGKYEDQYVSIQIVWTLTCWWRLWHNTK
jgi:hypothetical protein